MLRVEASRFQFVSVLTLVACLFTGVHELYRAVVPVKHLPSQISFCTAYVQYKSSSCSDERLSTNTANELHFVVSKETQHFWHFMMGELLPIVSQITRNPLVSSIVLHSQRKWYANPFDHFFDELAASMPGIKGRHSFNVSHVEVSKGSFEAAVQIPDIVYRERRAFQGAAFVHHCAWDSGTISLQSQRAFRQSAAFLRTLATTQTRPVVPYDQIIQMRIDDPVLKQYFATHSAGSSTYGAGKRYVPGFNDFAQEVRRFFGSRVGIISGDGLPLLDQIHPYLSATTLLSTHGAGMVHALWMPPSSTVVELVPASVPNTGDFSLLSKGNGLGVQGLAWMAPILGLLHIRVPCMDLSNKTSACYTSLRWQIHTLLS